MFKILQRLETVELGLLNDKSIVSHMSLQDSSLHRTHARDYHHLRKSCHGLIRLEVKRKGRKYHQGTKSDLQGRCNGFEEHRDQVMSSSLQELPESLNAKSSHRLRKNVAS